MINILEYETFPSHFLNTVMGGLPSEEHEP